MPSTKRDSFQQGLVFGFDVGTGSIGYAVRRGIDFLDVGVLICESEGSDLSKRRELRRQRRTLRSRQHRRKWFAGELAKLGVTPPESPFHDPIGLRLRALKGEHITPQELHAALTHLFRRRGYSKVPWANIEKETSGDGKKKAEEGEIKEAVQKMKAELDGKHPCQLLAERRAASGTSPKEAWGRKIYWPREALRDEFHAIVQAQKTSYPLLAEKSDWLLYGDSTRKTKGNESYPVFFSNQESRNPGVLGLRWPRFDNRGPTWMTPPG